MNCTRCSGLMVVDNCLDIKGGPGELWIKALRCIMCGNLVDPTINRHRTGFKAEVLPFQQTTSPSSTHSCSAFVCVNHENLFTSGRKNTALP